MIVVHLKNEAQLIVHSNTHLHDLILKNAFHDNKVIIIMSLS